MTKSQCRKAFEEWLKTNGVNDVSQNQEWLRDALYTAWLAGTKNGMHWSAMYAKGQADSSYEDRLYEEAVALDYLSENLHLCINDLDIEEKTP